jgi:hypothetical protein
MVAMAAQTTDTGAATPVAEMAAPATMVDTVTDRISGRFRTPESVGLELSMLWK